MCICVGLIVDTSRRRRRRPDRGSRRRPSEMQHETLVRARMLAVVLDVGGAVVVDDVACANDLRMCDARKPKYTPMYTHNLHTSTLSTAETIHTHRAHRRQFGANSIVASSSPSLVFVYMCSIVRLCVLVMLMMLVVGGSGFYSPSKTRRSHHRLSSDRLSARVDTVDAYVLRGCVWVEFDS